MTSIPSFDEFAAFEVNPIDHLFDGKKAKRTLKKATKRDAKRARVSALLGSAIDRSAYASADALNWSTLKRTIADPRQLFPAPEASDAMQFGTLFHAALLEPERYAENVVTFNPPVNPKTGEPFGATSKAYLEALAEWKSGLSPDALIATQKDVEKIGYMLESYSAAPVFRANWKKKPFRTELPLVTDDKVAGIQIKGRLDLYSDALGIVDVKTVNSPIVNWDGSDAFFWTAKRFGYIYELAYYSKIVQNITGILPPASMLVFEAVEPYRVGLYKISPKTITDAITRIDEDFIPMWLARPSYAPIVFEY